jgi:hypothetical protein
MFSREQYEQWRSFPEISRDELFRYFTLTSADVAFVDPGAGRGPADRLGLSVQLSTLPWLGFVPDDVASAPPVAVVRLAEQLGLDPGALRGYGKRAHTRSDHLNKVARYLGWKTAAAGSREIKELEQFLLDRAMEHDSPTLLFNLGREYLMSAKVIRPGAVTLAKMVGTARAGAAELTSQKVAHLLTPQVRQDLDLLLADDIGLGMSRCLLAAQLIPSRVPLTDPPGDRLAEIVNLVNPRQQGRTGPPCPVGRKVFRDDRTEKGKPNHRRRPRQARIAAGEKV